MHLGFEMLDPISLRSEVMVRHPGFAGLVLCLADHMVYAGAPDPVSKIGFEIVRDCAFAFMW
jgi:hypothetical protein